MTLVMQEDDHTGIPPGIISNLYQLLIYKPPYVLSLRSRLQMCLDVAFAMQHLTSKGFLHLDLASFNVLVWKDTKSGDVRCKLADFSFALNTRSISSSLKETGAVGGPPSRVKVTLPINRIAWMAPELISLDPSRPSERSEIYSFGMIVYEILTRRTPYEGIADHAVSQFVQNDQAREKQLQMPVEADVLPHNPHEDMRQQFQSLVALMRRCLKSQPAERPTFRDIVEQLQSIQGRQLVRSAPAAYACFNSCVFITRSPRFCQKTTFWFWYSSLSNDALLRATVLRLLS
jgi:serine/threonine protein kinase